MIESIRSVIVTVVSGVAVFVLGEILRDIWLTPLLQYKELKQEIAYMLSYYACYYSDPIEYQDNTVSREREKASTEIRKTASKLSGYIETISFVRFGIPNKSKLSDAASNLIALSNSMFLPKSGSKENGFVLNRIRNQIIFDLKLANYRKARKELSKQNKRV